MTLEERDAKLLVLNTTFLVRVRELLAGFPPAFGDCEAVGEAIAKYEEEYKLAKYRIEHEYAANAIQ